MRVIAGAAGGLPLVAPKRGSARPTTDRVKESLFGALGPDRLVDASVLDLYAGSGALAIEALSRGASRAVLVDRDHTAVDAIRRNLATTRLRGQARVQGSTVATFLGGKPPAERPFDVVLLDPPYDTSAADVARVLEALDDSGWLAPGATVVLERSSNAGPVVAPESWETAWERGYGDTLVTVLTISSS
ncbi:MAG: 16S rRNA (guanine(966)-N(2))-methyltransferase RsmD [Actinomycetota bacterium]|jgi:16S rRNA (guanine966-N2)-methyltransferase|nr:16S rRNA (guanine(966)-N(2))-methyltransferase RsmD [Actinomycetota bacterium]